MTDRIKYQFNGFVLDTDNPKLLKNGKEIKLRRQSCDVLIYLLGRRGNLVTKEELHRAIWGDAIVTKDSLTHCVIDIRKAIGDRDKTMIQTVPRRGYVVKMSVETAAINASSIVNDLATGDQSRDVITDFLKLNWARSLLLAASVGVLIWLFSDSILPGLSTSDIATRGPTERGKIQVARLEVIPVDEDELGRIAASSFVVALNRYGIANTVLPDPDVTNAPELTLETTMMESANRRVVDVRLIDVATQTSVWSARFDHHTTDMVTLFEQAAEQSVYAIECGLFRRDLIERPISPQLFGMWIRGCDLAVRQKRLEFYEQALAIVSYAPDDAASYSSLAIGLSRLNRRDSKATNYLDIDDELRGAAEKALELQPDSGEALVALSMTLPNNAWQQQEELLLKALQTDTPYRWARSQYAMFLYRVGRIQEASSFARRTTALAHGPNHMALDGWLLAINRQQAEADDVFDQAAQKWPRDDIAPWRRFTADAFFADTEVASIQLDQEKISSIILSTGSRVCWRNLIRARNNPRLIDSPDLFSSCRDDDEYIVPRALATLGFVDEAIEAVLSIVNEDKPATHRDFTTFFFNPEMELVRNDARFMSIAERAGLATYWYESSQLPDFCGEPELQYDCREAIASLVGPQIASN